MKRQLKKLLYPWWALALPRRHGQHPYFGPPTLPYGGPDLKARKLKARFGNAAWPTLAYVFSAKPPPAAFLRGLRRRKIPIVLNQNGVFYPAWDPVHYERNNQRLRELHEAADYVLYQSQFCFDSTQEWVRPPERPHRILYNAVDVQLFKPSKDKPSHPLVLLAATYFNPEKKYLLDYLQEVMRHFQKEGVPVRLRIAGKIAGSPAQKLPSGIEVVGPFAPSEAPAVYQQADALLHLTPLDACPTSVLEAMACGLPVLYSQSGGTAELVGEGGIALPVQASYVERALPDLPSISLAVKSVITNWADFSKRARVQAQRFSIQDWYRAHEKLFSELSI